MAYGEGEEAIADITKAIELQPDASLYAVRGSFHHMAKDYAKARDDYLTGINLNPNAPHSYNNLAWLEATCPNANFRDGKSAVEHATKACQLTGFKRSDYVGTLAAAYAEVGDFETAVKLAEQIEDENLESYRAGEPVRE